LLCEKAQKTDKSMDFTYRGWNCRINCSGGMAGMRCRVESWDIGVHSEQIIDRRMKNRPREAGGWEN